MEEASLEDGLEERLLDEDIFVEEELEGEELAEELSFELEETEVPPHPLNDRERRRPKANFFAICSIIFPRETDFSIKNIAY